MFTEETVKTVSGLFSIIEEVRARLNNSFTVEKKSSQGKLHLVFKDDRNTDLLCFGVWHELWERCQAPLWFGVNTNWSQEVVDRFKRNNQGKFITYDCFELCPIDQTIVAKNNCSEEIALLLEKQLK